MVALAAYFLLVVGGVEGFYEGVLSVVVALFGFVSVLLLTIVRPLWYVRLIKRVGITRPARPNDMVEAGLARSRQNNRLYKTVQGMENILIRAVAHVRSGPAAYSTLNRDTKRCVDMSVLYTVVTI